MRVLIQFPGGEEVGLDEAVELESTQHRSGTDRFIEWEAERMLCKTIGDYQAVQHEPTKHHA